MTMTITMKSMIFRVEMLCCLVSTSLLEEQTASIIKAEAKKHIQKIVLIILTAMAMCNLTTSDYFN